jgi:hypothetical protein
MLHSSRVRPFWLFLLILFIGLIIGSILGELLGKYAPVLARGPVLRLSTQTLSFGDVAGISFGFFVQLNILTMFGIILAIIILRNL